MNLPCKLRHILVCLYLNEGFGHVLMGASLSSLNDSLYTLLSWQHRYSPGSHSQALPGKAGNRNQEEVSGSLYHPFLTSTDGAGRTPKLQLPSVNCR